MKKLYILLPFALLSLTLFAQNPVLNPDFENWTSGTPNNWFTNNAGVNTPVTKATPVSYTHLTLPTSDLV